MNKIAPLLTLVCLGLLLAFNWGLLPLFPPLQQAIIPPAPLAPPSPAVAPPPSLEYFVHDLVNEHRMALGLKPLEFSREISTIAHVHSREMATRIISYGHGGKAPRAKRVSNFMPYRNFGENVAAINTAGKGGEGKAAVVRWLDSPRDRNNIEGDFTLTGIGIAQSWDGTYYFTQLFMAPASIAAVPAPAEVDPPPSASPPALADPPTPTPPPPLAAAPPPLEYFVHDLVNEHRTAQGLTPLAFSPEISDIARVHSEDMANGRVGYGHGGIENRRLAVANFIDRGLTAENVHTIRNHETPSLIAEEAVAGWLDSPGHRSNIEGDYNLTGIGIGRAAGWYYFTQLFVRSPPSRAESYGYRPPSPPAPPTLTVPKVMASHPAKRKRKVRSRSAPPRITEKDPRLRPGRRRTAGGWVQNLN